MPERSGPPPKTGQPPDMLTKEAVWIEARRQLALDLGCHVNFLDSPGNIVTKWRDPPER